MNLYTRKKKRTHLLPILLAIVALLLALVVMITWMWIGYRRSIPPDSTSSSDDTSHYDDPITDIGRCLLILDFADNKHFMLIQSDPSHNSITVSPIPAHTKDTDGNTLSTLFTKHGSLRVAQTISSILQLPVSHYITLDAAGTQQFLNELDSGIRFSLPEDILYTDENGAQIRLTAGEHVLSGAQTAAVMQYTAWSSHSTDANHIVADVVTAVLNQYITPNRRFDGYFAALSNVAQTDLRIDNFNAFRRTLEQLAAGNDGSLSRHEPLSGTIENGAFIPN